MKYLKIRETKLLKIQIICNSYKRAYQICRKYEDKYIKKLVFSLLIHILPEHMYSQILGINFSKSRIQEEKKSVIFC